MNINRFIFTLPVYLESVHLDLVLATDAFLYQQGLYLGTVVPLQLDALSIVFFYFYVTVAGEFFFEGLQDLLRVQVTRQPVQQSDGLATVSLRQANVYV